MHHKENNQQSGIRESRVSCHTWCMPNCFALHCVATIRSSSCCFCSRNLVKSSTTVQNNWHGYPIETKKNIFPRLYINLRVLVQFKSLLGFFNKLSLSCCSRDCVNIILKKKYLRTLTNLITLEAPIYRSR